jgi:hypothetical protein
MSALAVLLLLCGSSCLGGYLWGKATATRRDVTDQDILWGEFRRGGVYTLKYDFFLQETDSAWGERLCLSRSKPLPGSGDAPSIREYENEPADWPHIKGVVISGVRIRCVKLVSFGAPIFGRALFPFAEILDGPFQGTSVDISDLNSWKDADEGPNRMLLPNPDLRFVEEVTVDGIQDGP